MDPSLSRSRHLPKKTDKPLRLHLGCGKRRLRGFINIDSRKTSGADLVCDIRRLPFSDNAAELIESYHVIEHLARHDLKKALEEWLRVLAPGGRLIIECPDFDEIVKCYLSGDEKQLDGIFGLQRFAGDYHLFGYNMNRLSRVLRESGFDTIKEMTPQDYHAEEWPCLRVESQKSTMWEPDDVPH